jgi:hypothetical protein
VSRTLGSASYRGWMKRSPLVFALVLLVVPAYTAAGVGLPPWLAQAAHQAATHQSDGTAPTSIVYVAPRSRFPRVVLTGSFVCVSCSHGPNGAAAPSGTVAELRFDGKTHLSCDFALCTTCAQSG